MPLSADAFIFGRISRCLDRPVRWAGRGLADPRQPTRGEHPTALSPQPAPAESPALEEVLRRAASYLATYQRELGTIIAEEDYWQEVTESLPRVGNVAPSVRRQTRRLRSDFLFVQLPGETEVWVGFRDVFEVDGRRVHDRRERFRQAVEEMPGRTVDAWRRLHQESARWNLGTIRRDINVPTFALEVLRPDVQPRFEFTRRGLQRVAGESVWVVEYVERDRPRLIRNPEDLDLVARGRVWIASDSGRIVRTELVAEDEQRRLELSIRVDYRLERRLGLWVPVLMREQYHGWGHRPIDARARYSAFRRFEVDVRIIGSQSGTVRFRDGPVAPGHPAAQVSRCPAAQPLIHQQLVV